MKNKYDKMIVAVMLVLLCKVTILNAQIKNFSFENDKIDSERQIINKLNGWKVIEGNVELITSQVFPAVEGNQVLDLNGDQPGSISQTIKGLKKNSDYTLKFEYADQKGRIRDKSNLLATANIFVNDAKVATLRNLSAAPNYIGGIGFAFKSSAKGTATLIIASTTAGEMGLVIDKISIEEGSPLDPPVSDHLVNGSFEMKVDSDKSNPHLYGE